MIKFKPSIKPEKNNLYRTKRYSNKYKKSMGKMEYFSFNGKTHLFDNTIIYETIKKNGKLVSKKNIKCNTGSKIIGTVYKNNMSHKIKFIHNNYVYHIKQKYKKNNLYNECHIVKYKNIYGVIIKYFFDNIEDYEKKFIIKNNDDLTSKTIIKLKYPKDKDNNQIKMLYEKNNWNIYMNNNYLGSYENKNIKKNVTFIDIHGNVSYIKHKFGKYVKYQVKEIVDLQEEKEETKDQSQEENINKNIDDMENSFDIDDVSFP